MNIVMCFNAALRLLQGGFLYVFLSLAARRERAVIRIE